VHVNLVGVVQQVISITRPGPGTNGDCNAAQVANPTALFDAPRNHRLAQRTPNHVEVDSRHTGSRAKWRLVNAVLSTAEFRPLDPSTSISKRSILERDKQHPILERDKQHLHRTLVK